MRNAIILGAGRSGTSLAAGCLSRAGYHMGTDLIEPCETNPKGFFECRKINALNEDILRLVNARGAPRFLGRFGAQALRRNQYWLACLRHPTTFPLTDEIRKRIGESLLAKPYCLKDPRFCYTLPAWQPFLDNPVIVCVFRDPSAMIRSTLHEYATQGYLKNMDLSKNCLRRIWCAMYRSALAHHAASAATWLFLHYDQLLSGEGVTRLAAALEASADAGFVEPALCRSRRGPIRSAVVSQLYRRLCKLAGYEPPVAP